MDFMYNTQPAGGLLMTPRNGMKAANIYEPLISKHSEDNDSYHYSEDFQDRRVIIRKNSAKKKQDKEKE